MPRAVKPPEVELLRLYCRNGVSVWIRLLDLTVKAELIPREKREERRETRGEERREKRGERRDKSEERR